jgi:hypothetical protein
MIDEEVDRYRGWSNEMVKGVFGKAGYELLGIHDGMDRIG